MPIYTPLRFRISPSPRNPKKKISFLRRRRTCPARAGQRPLHPAARLLPRRRWPAPPRAASPPPLASSPRPTTTTAASAPPAAVPLAAREHRRRAARLHAGAAPAASSPTGGRVSGELRLRLLQCSGAASVSVRFQISDPPPVDFCPETLVFICDV